LKGLYSLRNFGFWILDFGLGTLVEEFVWFEMFMMFEEIKNFRFSILASEAN